MDVPPPTINLFSLATHCIHAAILASAPIQSLQRQCRMKDDGTLVTDADGAAQYIIYNELRALHSGLRIVGEESDLEMQAEENRRRGSSSSVIHEEHLDACAEDQNHDEIVISAHPHQASLTSSHPDILLEQIHGIMKEHETAATTATASSTLIEYQRVSVVVDPLDGTSSYAKGEYEVVTILIAIILDNFPVFGVIVKPFSAGIELETFRDTGCSIIYGGSLIGGVFTIGKDGRVVELERSRQFRLYGNLLTHRQPDEINGDISGRKRQDIDDIEVNHDNSLQNNGGKRCKMETSDSSKMVVTVLDQAQKERGKLIDNHKEPITAALNNSTPCDDNIQPQHVSPTTLPLSLLSLPSTSTGPRGSNTKTPPPTPTTTTATPPITTTTPLTSSIKSTNLFRAIISKSRSGGIVQKCINELSSQNLLHPEPLYITGAGYKTMKLVIGQDKEGLWFFPKPGTSLWDVAAADALLRVMGGRISDRFGKDLDYQKGRLDAENIHGIIACIDEFLHAKCVELCLKEKWDEDVQEQC
eukprot:CAMPEP_0176487494 /NCGR_PEP_ID=MMETSP0200_2-20121128/6167_1 /TAXON_ID=947934 /ORGANISM="Chaetoceros sp., Strain GSL56" /LENGTH=529 /DNA_ID=CAMNT_0017884337 /DNA_START=251 /DNA_END=1840 /DNA_ORIENTATION=-